MIQNINNSRADAERRIGNHIPDDKYQAYIRIFEGMKTLDDIKENLSPSQIQEVKTVEEKHPKIVPFPDVKKKYMKYKTLHNVLSQILTSSLRISDIDTIAGQEMLEGRSSLLNRTLWILAAYGKLDGESLTVDSITIYTHKKGTSGFTTTEGVWTRWLGILSKVGIYGELKLAPVDRSELITPVGWLREQLRGAKQPGYYLHVSFHRDLGGLDSLKLLSSYGTELNREFGTRAFLRFKKADMRYLLEKA
ncbi:MAG: hypothetical protein ACFFE2_03855 [Candidatus Thorarchaeota archaeon]